MKTRTLGLMILALVPLTACRQFDSGRGTTGGFQTDSGHAEGSTPYGLGRSSPFQRAGMADANIAASREEAALDVSGSGTGELSRRAAAATAEGPEDQAPLKANESQDLTPPASGDEAILDRVRLALGTDQDAARRPLSIQSLHNLEISVKNGVAILTGKAASPEERRAIESLVRGVEGVKTVDNQLELTDAPAER